MSDLQHVAAGLAYDQAAAVWLRAHVAPSGAAVSPAERLPLGTPVVFPNGAQGVVTGYSALSRQRYEIAWFDRHFWRVNRRCFDRAQFALYTGSAADADRSPAPAA